MSAADALARAGARRGPPHRAQPAGPRRLALLPVLALTLGTSAFPFNWTNRIKLSLEGALLFNAINSTLVSANPVIGWLPSDAGNQYSIRAQLQFGF